MTHLALLPLLFTPQGDAPVDPASLLGDLAWRTIGPANMGGRVVDLAVHPERSRIFYVASASGGLWKTTNNGTTFDVVFDDGGAASMGAVALAPSAPDTVWVGMGEPNARNSVSWGDGVYRSDDAGESWTHCGLGATRHVGAIAIHPTDPATVFVAALGSTWGPSPERGLYRSSDAGASWERVLHVDERTGCVDVVIDPERPDVVYAATYERMRDELDGDNPAVRTGPGSGIWRSVDGGGTWQRLSNGLPSTDLGRVGLDLFAGDTRVLFAIVETQRTGERGAPPRSEDRVSLGIKGRDHPQGGFAVESVTAGESAAQAGLEVGDVVLRVDETPVAGRADLVTALREYGPGDAATLVVLRGDGEETLDLGLLGRLLRSRARSFAGSQGGQVANAQDEQGDDGFETGGVFRSDDGGDSWRRVNSLDPRPFYYSQVRVDPSDDQRVFVLGIQVHASTDGGATFGTIARSVHSDHHALWIDPRDSEHALLGCDGGLYVTWDGGESWDHLDELPIAQFYNVAVDMRTPYNVYGGLQDNGTWGGPSRTRGGGVTIADWVTIGGGDGFRCAVDPTDPDVVYSESQNGVIQRLNVRTGERGRVERPRGNQGVRFNWNTPFLLSPHDPRTLYFAGNVVLRSRNRGENSETISEDLARTERGSATALEESPLEVGTLFCGTDDGALWRTVDGGETWEELTEHLPGLPGPRYVSDIICSHHDAGTVFVVLDGHRSDDYEPYVFVSRDGGESFSSIATGLPSGASTRTIAVDAVNPSLLFVGTETGCHVSLDGGATWTPFANGLPTVPVHDLVIHPRDGDLVAATHGRGVWIADIAPLQHLTPDVLARGVHLFPVAPAIRWNRPPDGDTSGARDFVAANPAGGAAIHYFLREAREGPVRLTVRDAEGSPVATLEGPGDAGLHRVHWDLRRRSGRGQGGNRNSGGPGGFGGFGGRGAGAVAQGDYQVVLDEDEQARTLTVLPDPAEAGVTEPPPSSAGAGAGQD